MLSRTKSVSDHLIKVDDIFIKSPAGVTTPVIDRQAVVLQRDKHNEMFDKRGAPADLPGSLSAR